MDAPPDVALTLGLADPRSRRRRLLRRAALAAGAAALATALLVATLAGNGDAERYTTQAARHGDLVVTVSATGTLQPTIQVDIGSELSGTIRTVEVDFNDSVVVGQVLAQLDTTRLEAQVLESKSALDSARARVRQTQASRAEAESQLARLQRVHEISGGQVPSRQELDAGIAAVARARADYASAQAFVVQAQATLDAQDTDLRKAVIRSPINGIVLTRAVEPGQTVAASLQAPVLFTLAEDLTRMELHVSVDEADVGHVEPGQEATFTVDAWPDRTFAAHVERVNYGSQTVEGVVTYETLLTVDNRDGQLRPGMTATAEITVQRVAEALLVPNAALRFAPAAAAGEERRSGGVLRALTGRPRFGSGARRPEAAARQDGAHENGQRDRSQRVWILRNGTPEAVSVRTGPTDGTWTELLDGEIAPGTELVVDAAPPSS